MLKAYKEHLQREHLRTTTEPETKAATAPPSKETAINMYLLYMHVTKKYLYRTVMDKLNRTKRFGHRIFSISLILPAALRPWS
jgi:hypothetical protein